VAGWEFPRRSWRILEPSTAIVEAVAPRGFRRTVEEGILEPLGMHDTALGASGTLPQLSEIERLRTGRSGMFKI
jgi:hypothetical protein